MKTHSKCMPAAIVLVVAIMTAMLEPAAFARSTDEESAAPVVLPNRPFVAPKIAMATAVPPRQTPVPAVQPIRQPESLVPPQSKSKSKKWIVIVAAVGAAGAAALLLRGGNDTPPVTPGGPLPTVIVGVPTVGQPQ
jgi:hypothetical protein